jgi:beta-aspartyl-peptidase (threonine type)
MGAAIIVHGGAKPIEPKKEAANRKGCLKATEAGWAVLQEGGSALEAVEAAVRVLETDPIFNAGFGSTLNAVGRVEMDAAIMEGETHHAGAIGAVEGIRHPISVARLALDEHVVMLVGPGARRFAERRGAEMCEPEEMICPSCKEEWEAERAGPGGVPGRQDTVGAVAIDLRGTIAAATSTGGLLNKPPGRVGDSPLIGCGLYADNAFGGCSSTGEGEAIMRVVLAKTAVDLLQDGRHPADAALAVLKHLEERVEGEAGIILIDKDGRVGWAHNSTEMAVAYMSPGLDAPRAFVRQQDDADMKGHWNGGDSSGGKIRVA